MSEIPSELTGVLAVVEDLLFLSKIDGLASANAIPCTRARTAPDLEAALAGSPKALVFVDLGLRSMDPIAAIARIRRQPGWEKTAVLSFGSHVNTDKLDAAKAAGANGAMPNSQFTRMLPDLIRAARPERS